MTEMANYLANLVRAQIKGTQPDRIPDGIELNEIVDIAQRNHMMYILMNSLIISGSLSDDMTGYFKQALVGYFFRSARQYNAYRELVREFEAKGVRSLPMKGSIMKGIYPSPEMRDMSDIDILIAADDMQNAKGVLTELGYDLAHVEVHHDIYVKDQVIVEAHSAMYDKTVDRNQYEYFLGFDKASLRDGHKSTYDLSKEDFYVYMLAHAAKHFYAMGCGIRNLVDVYVYLEKYGKEMDTQYVDRELEKCGILSFAKQVEELAYRWLEGRSIGRGTESEEFYENLFQYMCDSGIYGKDANGIWNKFAEEDCDATNGDLKKWYFFPPASYMIKYYPWLSGKEFLLPVAWMIRFCRGAFMHKGEKKVKMVEGITESEIKTYQQIYRTMKLKFTEH